MTWTLYLTFLAFAAVVVIAPGPDFAVTVKNALSGGRGTGLAAAAGITTSNLVHGTVAAVGLGALLVASHQVFTAVRWIGAAYLCYLAFQALRSAWKGEYAAAPAEDRGRGGLARGWAQGFLSNITNPKVLAFYLSVLPQFLAGGAGLAAGALLAYSHAALSLLWLAAIVLLLHRARAWVTRRRFRRALDAGTGAALLGFAGALAAGGGRA
ncbi:LysE family translocator [Nocardiopsis composta]|uniref:Threonine/homoserine/homoserine lactone efflux protein n=1 Tax=Nocardiopsis composta TaxID=157465 RepID=A0A7W8VGX3_9ACTN|nr:LysE family translocator [Nocardiopsis composta]MBB5435608.1 threonine/homoserine/homoserine lactone efflux protein [Nocardiopsis composta]